mmetsp:Transcript_117872/g.279713  ORF Transcript_117872/g.279713 Transcript_117872/m.279713 type:complete len:213 (-) Transcript_117872:256-894(-)
MAASDISDAPLSAAPCVAPGTLCEASTARDRMPTDCVKACTSPSSLAKRSLETASFPVSPAVKASSLSAAASAALPAASAVASPTSASAFGALAAAAAAWPSVGSCFACSACCSARWACSVSCATCASSCCSVSSFPGSSIPSSLPSNGWKDSSSWLILSFSSASSCPSCAFTWSQALLTTSTCSLADFASGPPASASASASGRTRSMTSLV